MKKSEAYHKMENVESSLRLQVFSLKQGVSSADEAAMIDKIKQAADDIKQLCDYAFDADDQELSKRLKRLNPTIIALLNNIAFPYDLYLTRMLNYLRFVKRMNKTIKPHTEEPFRDDTDFSTLQKYSPVKAIPSTNLLTFLINNNVVPDIDTKYFFDCILHAHFKQLFAASKSKTKFKNFLYVLIRNYFSDVYYDAVLADLGLKKHDFTKLKDAKFISGLNEII